VERYSHPLASANPKFLLHIALLASASNHHEILLLDIRDSFMVFRHASHSLNQQEFFSDAPQGEPAKISIHSTKSFLLVKICFCRRLFRSPQNLMSQHAALHIAQSLS
jgi:hypothetical protein